ncbi:MAG: IS1634 family transposase [Actinobacteria bacterium]|nr:IS1634 family transposase [Actinomycetota bacterium]
MTTRRHYKGKVYETHLLRRSYREDGRVKNETVGNISHLPRHLIEIIRRSLKGEVFLGQDEPLRVVRSLPHGDAAAVYAEAQALGFPDILGPACRERDLALALILSRVLHPAAKLASGRYLEDTTLGRDLEVPGDDTDALYGALDWLGARQAAIEKSLARRHLSPGGLVLFDLTSSYVTGNKCPWAARGYSRDGKRGTLPITYGLITTALGCPVAVEVFPGNCADPGAFSRALATVRERFGLTQVVLVGDRGMTTQARSEEVEAHPDLSFITALRAPEIEALSRAGYIQLSLFAEVNLVEMRHLEHPEERLLVCRNPHLASERARCREEMLAATEEDLRKVREAVLAGRLRSEAAIGLRVGRIMNRYKMAKHFTLAIEEGHFDYARKEEQIAQEAALDGIYVLRTSVPEQQLPASEVVAAYKRLSRVEDAFRSLKSVDLKIRPLYHRLEERVRAHAFLCLLAEYLVFHLREAWAPLTFADEEQNHPRADAVAKAERGGGAEEKARTQKTAEGAVCPSLPTLLAHLATLTRNTIALPAQGGITFERLTEPTPLQRRAFELLGASIPLRFR